MTEELNLLREALRRVKYEAASLADAQVIALEALTQRPAAQTERGAFENAALAKWGPLDFERSEAVPEMYYNQRLDNAWIGFGFAVAWLRASLPTQHATQQATPEPDDAQRRFEAGCVVLEYLRDIGAPYRAVHHMLIALHGDPEAKSKATPEPVGEVFQFHPMPEGWPARFRCDSCDGNGELGELVSMGDFQPPERQTCPDCGGRGWTSEEHAFNADHLREFAEAHALLTRPAPGVPEGWTVSAYKAAGLTIQSMAQLKGPDLWKIADAAGNVLNKQGEWEWEPMPSSRDDAFLARCRYATLAEASAALAAAQAKGADK